MNHSPLILALGNPDRGDDGLGPEVAKRLRRCVQDEELRVLRGEATEILDAWEGRSSVLIIDALQGDGPAGEIVRQEMGSETLELGSQTSTHGSGLLEAYRLGDVLDNLPPRVDLLGVWGSVFEMTDELSSVVAACVPQIEEYAKQWLQKERTHA